MKCGNSLCKTEVYGVQKYCCDACKQRAYRARKKGERLNVYIYKTDRHKK
jgi:hypothetical protein